MLYNEDIPILLLSPSLDITSYRIKDEIIDTNSKYPVYTSQLPKLAIRTNLLYDFDVFTPNMSIEGSLNPHSTLLFTGSYNGWRNKSLEENNKKLWHWTIGGEYKACRY